MSKTRNGTVHVDVPKNPPAVPGRDQQIRAVVRTAGEGCAYAGVCNQLGDAGIFLDEDEFLRVHAELFPDRLEAELRTRRRELARPAPTAQELPEPPPAAELNRFERAEKVRQIVTARGRGVSLEEASRDAGFPVTPKQLERAKYAVFGNARGDGQGRGRPKKPKAAPAARPTPPPVVRQAAAPAPVPAAPAVNPVAHIEALSAARAWSGGWDNVRRLVDVLEALEARS